mgnify:FL=1
MPVKVTRREQDILMISLDGSLCAEMELELREVLDKALATTKKLELDLSNLTDISTEGLREILRAQKIINGLGGSMTVRNVNREIMEEFEMIGFVKFLNIE